MAKYVAEKLQPEWTYYGAGSREYLFLSEVDQADRDFGIVGIEVASVEAADQRFWSNQTPGKRKNARLLLCHPDTDVWEDVGVMDHDTAIQRAEEHAALWLRILKTQRTMADILKASAQENYQRWAATRTQITRTVTLTLTEGEWNYLEDDRVYSGHDHIGDTVASHLRHSPHIQGTWQPLGSSPAHLLTED